MNEQISQGYALLVSRDKFVHHTTSDGHARQDRRHSESESPLPHIRQNETSDEGRQEADGERNLLRCSLLYQIYVKKQPMINTLPS